MEENEWLDEDSLLICDFCEKELDIEDRICPLCGNTKEEAYT